MMLFREMNERRRFKRLPLKEREIVFYAEHAGYFPSFEGLINELTNRHKLVVAYITSQPDDPILSSPPAGVRPFYLRNSLPLFAAFLKCRVFVMTLTDLNRYELKRSVNPVHYVYVFHALVSTHMMYEPGAFDHYDSILCAGPHHIQELRADETRRSLPAKHLIEAGYYRLERIVSARSAREDKPTAERPTILIAPSWGNKNIIESCGERLVESLLGDDFRVIVRPHPETIRRSPKVVDALARRFGSDQRFTLERSVATDDSLLEADVLICDLSGVALEYALGTERPVLFIDMPPKVKNPDYPALGIEPLELALRRELGSIISPDRLDTVGAAIRGLLDRRGAYQQRLAQLRAQWVFNFGRSSAVGADYIAGLLHQG